MKYEIGDKFVGFKFEDEGIPGFPEEMDEYVGKEGTVIVVDPSEDSPIVLVEFDDGVGWWYPVQI